MVADGREVVLDTETTGLDPGAGHRVVEIGCIELINHVPTGRFYHQYVNPGRSMPSDAQSVHGLTHDFLVKHPPFEEIAGAFVDFIADARLVIHNASFDIGFVNAELEAAAMATLTMDRVVDTLDLARARHPFGPNSLDALCRRYGIDNSERTVHGAMLDCQLLAEVYLELIGGRQPGLGLDTRPQVEGFEIEWQRLPPRPAPLAPRLTAAEEAAHLAFIGTLGKTAVWHRYLGGQTR
jgi:DNA polymerase-3 subunit epsilon